MSFLPGQFPGILGGPSVSSLSKHDDATAASTSVTLPATAQEGDLILIHNFAWQGSGGEVTKVVPTGYTEIADAEGHSLGNGVRCTHSYKIATSSDASATVTGMDAGSGEHLVALILRGDVAITSVSAYSVNSQGTVSDPAEQTVTASSGTAPLVVGAGYGASGTFTDHSFSPAEDEDLTVGDNHSHLRYKIYNASPADHTLARISHTGHGLRAAPVWTGQEGRAVRCRRIGQAA